jgi:hypothetical protein
LDQVGLEPALLNRKQNGVDGYAGAFEAIRRLRRVVVGRGRRVA